MPTPGPCKSSRPPALSVRLPWRAVLHSAPSKHCARRRLLAHTPKAAGQLAGSPLPALSPPNARDGRAVELSKIPALCLVRDRTRVNCLEGKYVHYYTTIAAQPRETPAPGSAQALSPTLQHPCQDAQSASPKGRGRRRRDPGGLAAGQRATAATKKGVWPPRRGIEPRSPA